MPGANPGEIVLYTEVTTSCSNACEFCPIGLVARRGVIHPDVWRGVLHLISSCPGRKFIVYPHLVGEPLLFPGIEEYLRSLAAFPNVELWLCTNGVLLDEARLQSLCECGLRNIWFSLFYATPADYRKHTCTDHFHAARRNLDHLVKRSAAFDKIHIVLFSESTPDLEALIRDQPNVTLEVRRHVHPWKRQGRLYGQKWFRLLFSTLGKFRTKYICVSIDGEVNFDWRDHSFRSSIGNIRDLHPSVIMRRIDAGIAGFLRQVRSRIPVSPLRIAREILRANLAGIMPGVVPGEDPAALCKFLGHHPLFRTVPDLHPVARRSR